MNIEQIEHLIQEADAAGKKTLVLGYLFISVKETLEMKAQWEFHVAEACKRLAQYRTESECSISEYYICHACHACRQLLLLISWKFRATNTLRRQSAYSCRNLRNYVAVAISHK